MSKRKTAPPDGAEVLYSRAKAEWSEGLVRLEMRSGAHVVCALMTLATAVSLHRTLTLTALAARRDSIEAVGDMSKT